MQFGEFLLSRNLVTSEQLSHALELQRNYNRPMGIFAQKLGYVSRKNNVRILLEHIKSGKRYGDIAFDKGLLTREQLSEVLEAQSLQSRENVMLGKVLVQTGVLTRSQLITALQVFTNSMF